MVEPQKLRYLTSMADELHSQSTRVRDLIGSTHWLSDGQHKEHLLRDFLARHLPSGLLAARGFVIHPDDDSLCSREQDILIVDTLIESPVFYQGGLVIAFPSAIVAAISVKTTMDKDEVVNSVEGLNSVRAVALHNSSVCNIWCGSYHFELGKTAANDMTHPYDYILSGIEQNKLKRPLILPEHAPAVGPEMVCSSKEAAFVLSYQYAGEDKTAVSARIRGFRCADQATAVFLASLLDHVALRRGLTDSTFARFAESDSIVPLERPEIASRQSFK